MGILILLIAILAFSIWSSYHWLVVRNWDVSSEKINGSVKMVVMSDLHTSEFGTDNEKLVETVAAQSPDLIILAGDMINQDAEDDGAVCSLVSRLSDIADVYYGLGNHEIEYLEQRSVVEHYYGMHYVNIDPDNELVQHLEEAGAHVLEQTYEDIEVNGTAIRIGGMYNYAFGMDGFDSAESAPDMVKWFLTSMQETDALKVLIAHRPDTVVFGNASSYWDLDLVISGHDHGGQIAWGDHGLYGGDQGFFPEYVHGLHQKDNMQIFITSGLGSQKELLPRVNNRPEVAVLTLGKS